MTAPILFRINDVHGIRVHLARESADLLTLTIKRASTRQYARIDHADAAQLATALIDASHTPGAVLARFLDHDGDGVVATREPDSLIQLTFSRLEDDTHDYAQFTDADAADLAAALATAAGIPLATPTPEDIQITNAGAPPLRTLVRVTDRLRDGDTVTAAREIRTGGYVLAITYGDGTGLCAWVQISDADAARLAQALTSPREPHQPDPDDQPSR
ncbi:hypothetical protein [Nocardia yamanashiensis]|uniref:hypothetical protein n=1 Tax=Nocardia yamanashiensis TaxID=209247 RepID=UPI0008311584|nr:hypothetical protein [Nocardia yamanashiensis]